jgi:hypothetical protein
MAKVGDQNKAPFKDFARPTGEATHTTDDETGAVAPGPVDPRATVTLSKAKEAAAVNNKYLEPQRHRTRYSGNNPHLQDPHSNLEALVMQALRRYGDMHPGTVDGEVMMMFIEFANYVIEELRAHPYWDNLEMDYYIHMTDVRPIPDPIMVSGLLYQYAIQQQSNKVEAYGPMYFKTMNRILYNRKYGNAEIEMAPWDVSESNAPAGKRSYDAKR